MNENELQLRTAYWDDLAARGSFKSFIRDIHGLDFSAWESAGFWDDAYRPFSFFVGGEVVASVCLYLLDAVIEGRATKVAQISGVGTRPEWRRRGLNRQLTEMALEWGRSRFEGLFLFSDTDAIPFYESCGFEPQAEPKAREDRHRGSVGWEDRLQAEPKLGKEPQRRVQLRARKHNFSESVAHGSNPRPASSKPPPTVVHAVL